MGAEAGSGSKAGRLRKEEQKNAEGTDTHESDPDALLRMRGISPGNNALPSDRLPAVCVS